MTYRDPSPPVPRPWRLCEVGDAVRPTDAARSIHWSMWANTPCTQDQYKPYVPLPAVGVVESVRSAAPVRYLNVRWEDGSVSHWEDGMLDPLAGR